MRDTGRIKKPLSKRMRKIVFETNIEDAITNILPMIAMIDEAQLLMLAHVDLINERDLRRSLQAIDTIRKQKFDVFRGQEPIRGIYLLWERVLADVAGEDVAGLAHLGRSRNDLNATLLRMRLRRPALRLLRETLRLGTTLLARAEDFSDWTTVGYTQYQPAVPTTLGHKLLAWATALTRDAGAVLEARADLDRCTLGAGAMGGTSLPIDTKYVSELLGFTSLASNSLDAVASRDFVLRLTAASAVLAVTISRIASDLLLMTTHEFGLITLPDELVGSSSQMPQKRNPFLLELSQSRGMLALGTFVTAGSSMHGVCFSNSFAVGTEAVRGVEGALRSVTESIFVLRQIITGMKASSEKTKVVAEETFITASTLAERIASTRRLPFRAAHHLVGRIVTKALDEGHPFVEVAKTELKKMDIECDLTKLDPSSVALAADRGGGPGLNSMSAQCQTLQAGFRRLQGEICSINSQYRNARLRLRQEVQTFLMKKSKS